MNTVFPSLSLDRKKVQWEGFLETLTPVERRGDLYFKREDFFAPLGYGGINGAKVRQIVWIVERYLKESAKGTRGLLLAGSVRSPQLGRVATVAKHFGIPCQLVIGTTLQSAYPKHENVRIAANLGASFHSIKIAYNPAIQKAARDLHAKMPGFYLMEYGLSVEGTPERIEGFYRFCSEQVRNLPEEVETILMPAGSCNSTIALLYGIARFRPKGLRRVILFGIGPTRIEWYEERLALLEKQSGTKIGGIFHRNYLHHPKLADRWKGKGYELRHHDLHASKFATYEDEYPTRHEGIDLHPVYEGKMMTYIRKHPDLAKHLDDGRSLFWIVGSAPSWSAMESNVGRLDDL